MRRMPFVLASLAVFGAPAAPAPQPAPAPPRAFSADECAVFERELAFADSVARHDAAAFAEKIHPEAAFSASNPAPQHGRAAIVQAWAGIVSGKDVRLEWYPDRTTIGGEGDIAWSTGPALFDDPAPGAAQRYRMSRFQSVWHRGADGVWRVLFDDGSRPRPATDAEAAAFRAAPPRACPRA